MADREIFAACDVAFVKVAEYSTGYRVSVQQQTGEPITLDFLGGNGGHYGVDLLRDNEFIDGR